MKKYAAIGLLCILCALAGCSEEATTLTGDKPPVVTIDIGQAVQEATLGTYCWQRGCVDKVGPEGLLANKEPLTVAAGAKVKIVMTYKPQPTTTSLMQIQGEQQQEIAMQNASFIAPSEPGLYYYSYGVWWLDTAEKDVSNGDAFYAFHLQVK